MSNRNLAVKLGQDNNVKDEIHIECIEVLLKTTFAFSTYTKKEAPTNDQANALITVVSAFVNEIKDITKDYVGYKRKMSLFKETGIR